MSILEQFALSLQPTSKPSEEFEKAQDWRLDRERGIADLMYKRSLNSRAAIETEAAKAEFEDYQLNRSINNEVKTMQGIGSLVDLAIANNDVDEALVHQRILNPDIPGDAMPARVKKDGVEMIGWKSPSTGQDGIIGSGSTAGLQQLRIKEAQKAADHVRDMELLKAKDKVARTAAMSTPQLSKFDIETVGAYLKDKEIEDKTLIGSAIGSTSSLKDKLSRESYRAMSTDIASKVNALAAEFKARGVAFDHADIARKLTDAAVESGIRNEEGTLSSSVTYDPKAANDYMEMTKNIILYAPQIAEARRRLGDKLAGATDEQLVRSFMKQEQALQPE